MSSTLELHHKVFQKNDELAAENRDLFADKGVCVIDLLSSPGSGKTSTILALIRALKEDYTIAVIEGDIAGDVDARAIKETGCHAVQINTGGLCHLESKMIKRAALSLPLDEIDLIIIENVGNLVCPVDFDLGECCKCMILSVPEGDDKPIKYPGVFQASQAIILNKIDTLPAFDFDMQAFEDTLSKLNPSAPIFKIAATRDTGLEELSAWVRSKINEVKRVQKRREE